MSRSFLFVGGVRDGTICAAPEKSQVIAVPVLPAVPKGIKSGDVHPDTFEVCEYHRKLFHMELFAVEDLPAETLMKRFLEGYLMRANQPSKLEWLMQRVHSLEGAVR